ncbi:hypothetical protein Tco_0051750 [Tanacetum coccineum]
MESVKKSIDERAQHKREYDSWVNERQIQTAEDKVDTGKYDASLGNTESMGPTESKEQDTSSRSGNDAHADDADIRPIYDEEPMAEVQTTAEINIFATGQQHTERPEFNNEGKVDQNVEQCHDTCPLPAKFTDNQTTELSNQSLESENIHLKKTVAQFQKDFSRMEAHCVNLELKYQVLKEGQHGQFSKVKSNEAKVKHDTDVIETINIELEHKVAQLLEENETLKRHNKEMFDSIKTIRAKNIEHTASLIANNDKFKAQLQEKGFAIAALKNELRKLTGNSVNTNLFKATVCPQDLDVNNDLSKPVTTQYLPKERESAVAKPHHMIAPGSSRYSSNDMVHNHYLEEAKKKTQESSRNSEPSVMPSARSQSTANGSKPKPRINNQKSRNWPASKSSCVTTKTVPIAEHSLEFQEVFPTLNILFAQHVRNVSLMPIMILVWVPTGKIFTSSTTKVDSEPQNGSNEDITNQYECEQTLDVSAAMTSVHISSGLVLHQMTSDHNSSELGIHDHSNELSRSKLVPKVVPPADKTDTSRQELELPFHHHITMLRYSIYTDTYKDGDGDASFQLKSDSLPHAHAQTTKTYYKHQDSRIMKAQELKTKTSAQTLIYKIFLQRYQVYQGRLLASFQDDAKYEHVGQDTRSQGGKDDQDKQGKDLKISDKKDKVNKARGAMIHWKSIIEESILKIWGLNIKKGADDEEIYEGGIPRVIVLGYDGLPMQPVAPPSPDYIPGPEDPQTPPVPQDKDEREPMFVQAHDPDYVSEPIYPEYIPLEDEHEFPTEEQPLPPVDSPTAESPGYVTESDHKEDPEEYEDDETEDGSVDYPIDGGDDGDDDDCDLSRDDANDEDEDEDEEKEEEHLAPADSAIVVPVDEPVFPPEGT